MIVPVPPGGTVDIVTRVVAQKMTEVTGQSVVIDNRGGAFTIIGSEIVARAPADGYTLLSNTLPLVVNPSLFAKLPFDPMRDFAPISLVAAAPFVLAVHPSVPAKTVAELVAHAKANAGKLNYGSGLGTPPHIAWGLFKLLTKTDVLYVPYKGAAPAITDLLAGQLHFIIDAPGVLLPHIQQGKLRALAVTSPTRSADLPGVPTMAEAGYPKFVMTFWTGVVAPAGTPAAVVERLNKVINDGLASDAMKKSLARFRVQPKPGSPKDFAAFIASESKKWAGVISAAGIKVE
jgi:tripartite-type tricarboxylate transporter receptor subunit TctC